MAADLSQQAEHAANRELVYRPASWDARAQRRARIGSELYGRDGNRYYLAHLDHYGTAATWPVGTSSATSATPERPG